MNEIEKSLFRMSLIGKLTRWLSENLGKNIITCSLPHPIGFSIVTSVFIAGVLSYYLRSLFFPRALVSRYAPFILFR